MNDIPEDILQAARKIAKGVALPHAPLDWDVHSIARALLAERMAERERCAKIADSIRVQKEMLDRFVAERRAIRNQDKP